MIDKNFVKETYKSFNRTISDDELAIVMTIIEKVRDEDHLKSLDEAMVAHCETCAIVDCVVRGEYGLYSDGALCTERQEVRRSMKRWRKLTETDNVSQDIRGWFDCLNGIAIEAEHMNDIDLNNLLLGTMESAGITIEEVEWAESREYTALKEVLSIYKSRKKQ